MKLALCAGCIGLSTWVLPMGLVMEGEVTYYCCTPWVYLGHPATHKSYLKGLSALGLDQRGIPGKGALSS